MADDLRMEVRALRAAVVDLAHRVTVNPDPLPPETRWQEPLSTEVYAEWCIQPRYLSVRAGRPDGIPAVFLVDRYGDMLALSTQDTQRLVEALTSGLHYVRDDLTTRRFAR